MQSKPFLSIVIPVYNGELVINRCLNSIWTQGLDESTFEVICVNDCSTDNTEQVIKQIQESHANLRLLSNPVNKRAGGSRNYGVKEAEGKYIVFIDADDYFHNNCFPAIIQYLQQTDLDILMCDFARETENQPNDNIFLNFPNREILSGHDFLLANSCPFGPCKYFFKRDLMCSQQIFFEENVCCEDVDWVHKLTLAAQTIQYQPILLSHVIINELSQTANEHKALRPISEKFFAGYRMLQLAEQYREDSEVNNRLKNVAYIYYKQGLKYFTALHANVLDKTSVLKKYLPSKTKGIPKMITYTKKFSFIYSLLTNITAPIIVYFISVKRKWKGR